MFFFVLKLIVAINDAIICSTGELCSTENYVKRFKDSMLKIRSDKLQPCKKKKSDPSM